METITRCRSCGAPRLDTILSLGEVPVADRLISPAEREPTPRFPLTLQFCPSCTLVQIRETLPPHELFCRDYPYHSSFSEQLVAHSRTNALRLIQDERLGDTSQVIELASNDGYMLRHFAERGIPVLGVDPAEAPVRAARRLGIPTEQTFFTVELAKQWRDAGRMADVVIANNVLAHVADTNGFVEGIRTILKPGGVACLEFPYVRDLIERCEFDTIYHQHLCYFSLTAVDSLMRRAGLVVHDVQRLPIHGGSLRILVSHDRPRRPAVEQLLEQEQKCGMTGVSFYQDFAERVAAVCRSLRETILQLAAGRHRIAAYGAAAKGTTLLGCLGLPDGLIEYVVDRNVHKHGRCLPSGRIPIEGVERLLADRPDFVLLLAWNFRQEILRQQQAYRRQGGRFIVPIPEVQVL